MRGYQLSCLTHACTRICVNLSSAEANDAPATELKASLTGTILSERFAVGVPDVAVELDADLVIRQCEVDAVPPSERGVLGLQKSDPR